MFSADSVSLEISGAVGFLNFAEILLLKSVISKGVRSACVRESAEYPLLDSNALTPSGSAPRNWPTADCGSANKIARSLASKFRSSRCELSLS